MQTSHPIEDVIPFLPEVGDPLLTAARRIRKELADIASAGERVARRHGDVVSQRRDLLARVQSNFTSDEIQAAERRFCARHDLGADGSSRSSLPVGCDRFTIVVDHVGQTPRYGADDLATAEVRVFFDHPARTAVVLMIDMAYGASVTNAAEQIVAFIQHHHLDPRGIVARNERWIYRDNMGSWDEIVVSEHSGGRPSTTAFRTLGDRTLDQAIAAVVDAGLVFTSEDRRALERSQRIADDADFRNGNRQ